MVRILNAIQWNFVCYALLILGLAFLFSSSIQLMFRTSLLKVKSIRTARTFEKAETKKTMTQILRQTFLSLNHPPKSLKWKIPLFYAITTLLGFGALLVFSVKVNASFGLLMGVIGALAPATFLFVQLKKVRINSSYEGDTLINEFTNQYKIRHRNIIEALEATAGNIPEAPLTARDMLRLCQRLREVREDNDIDEALDDFIFMIDTEWARKFAMSLSSGLKDHVILDESLADLADEIAKARKIIEQSKRNNNESSVIIKFITIPLYLGTMILGSRYMGSSPADAFHNQFGTATGLKYFAFVVICYSISIALMLMFDNQKMDLD